MFDVSRTLLHSPNRTPENPHAAVHRFVLLQGRLQSVRQVHRAKERKLRTRRLILIGSYMEHLTGQDTAAKARLFQGLDKFLTRARDRVLFDLPPKEDLK